MVLKKFNPTTPSRRQMTMPTFEEVTTNAPEKLLLVFLKKTGGRNAQDKATVRHHGSGVKKKCRIIDFKRNKDGIPTKATTVEHDPDRSVYIAPVAYTDGEKRYILAPVGLRVGDTVVSEPGTDIKLGNALQLEHMPVGTFAHNTELRAGKDDQMVRSAGVSAQLMAKKGNYATLKLLSGKMRYVRIECKATVETVSNITHEIVNIDKTGRKGHMGWRPTARGSAINPYDCPHDGKKGRSPIDRLSSVIPWGKPTLGYKTRRNRKCSDRFIIRRRNAK